MVIDGKLQACLAGSLRRMGGNRGTAWRNRDVD